MTLLEFQSHSRMDKILEIQLENNPAFDSLKIELQLFELLYETLHRFDHNFSAR